MNAVTLLNINQLRHYVVTIPYDRVYQIGQATFKLFNGWLMACYGAIEVRNGVTDEERLARQRPVTARIKDALGGFYQKIRNVHLDNIDFSKMHGSLFMLSGICGGVAAFHHFGVVNIGRFHRGLEFIGHGAFLSANVVEMQHNIRQLRHHAEEIVKEVGSPNVKMTDSIRIEDNVKKLRVSSVLGLIKSLNYILTTALLLYGLSFSNVAIFAVIGLIASCIKIVYDYFCLNLSEND